MVTKTITHGACTVNIHRPELTAAERSRREQATKDTLERVLSAYTSRKNRTQKLKTT